MAKYVVAGKSNCPFYARAEMLADELVTRVPDFSVHKIVVAAEEWDDWLLNTCTDKDWKYNGDSPVIWRELINRGGKGVLLGSCNEFLEMAKGYYGITCSKKTEQLICIANENKVTNNQLTLEEKEILSSKRIFAITLINADSDSAYALLPHLSSTDLLNVKNHEIHVKLYSDNEDNIDALNGIKMEVEDCSLPDVTEVKSESNLKSALINSHLVVYFSEVSNWDAAAVTKIKNYGNEMNNLVDKNCKVFILGRHCMEVCYLLSQFCTMLPRENFFALSRLAENKVKAMLAKKLSVLTAGISNLVIWGSSPDFVIDYSNSKAKGYDGAIWAPHLKEFYHNVTEMIYDKQWLEEELPKVLDQDKVDRKNAMAMSAAFISQISDIMNPGRCDVTSLGIISKGWYGVPEGLVFSFPVIYTSGRVLVKEDLNVTELMKEKILNAATKLQDNCSKLLGDATSS